MNTLLTRFLSRFFFVLLGAVFANAPSAQADYPTKAIKVIVPFTPGGGTDIIARDVWNKVTINNPKWTAVVDNKPGSGGNLGVNEVAKAPADGYHLVIGQTSNLAINPTLYSKLPYDSVNDLTPIALAGNSPVLYIVPANSPFKTLADIVAASKANPGSINYGSAGNGTVGHLATEMLQREIGIKLTHIPYRGAAQALTDVISGQIQLYVSSVPSLLGHIKSGKVRAITVTSLKRVDDIPNVPTVSESGYKGFEAVTWFGFLGPAKLPANLVTLLNTEINKALNSPDLKKRLEDQGLEITPNTPTHFANLIKSDIPKWGKVVKESGAKVD